MFQFNVGFGIVVGLAVLMLVVAAVEGNFTVGQQTRRGITDGLPVTRHLALYSDLLLLPFLVGVMWQYRSHWSFGEILLLSLICIAGTMYMHQEWKRGAVAQECILSPDKLTVCGWVHVAYMAFVVTLIPLFYLCTPFYASSLRDKVTVGSLFIFHMILATFGVAQMKKKAGPLARGATYMILFCAGAILGAMLPDLLW